MSATIYTEKPPLGVTFRVFKGDLDACTREALAKGLEVDGSYYHRGHLFVPVAQMVTTITCNGEEDY